MVCQRCINVVEEILSNQKIGYLKVELGKVQLSKALKDDERVLFSEQLLNEGFELLSTQELKIVNEIKTFLIRFFNKTGSTIEDNMSAALSKELAKDYSYLSKLFSNFEGRTIENYLIHLRLERVKELLSYKQKTISEIAYELGFSSSAHLSNQFKKHVGISPSMFQKLKDSQRINLDEL